MVLILYVGLLPVLIPRAHDMQAGNPLGGLVFSNNLPTAKGTITQGENWSQYVVALPLGIWLTMQIGSWDLALSVSKSATIPSNPRIIAKSMTLFPRSSPDFNNFSVPPQYIRLGASLV